MAMRQRVVCRTEGRTGRWERDTKGWEVGRKERPVKEVAGAKADVVRRNMIVRRRK